MHFCEARKKKKTGCGIAKYQTACTDQLQLISPLPGPLLQLSVPPLHKLVQVYLGRGKQSQLGHRVRAKSRTRNSRLESRKSSNVHWSLRSVPECWRERGKVL